MILIVLVCLLVCGGAVWLVYQNVVAANNIVRKDRFEFYIHTGTDYGEVLAMLEDSVVKDITSFDWLATKMNYPSHVYPGRYVLQAPMSNRELIVRLRSGKQEPVKVVFNKFRTKEDFAGHVAENLEFDSLQLLRMLEDREYLESIGWNSYNIMGLFIPNTYEFYWNTSADKFMERMIREYDAFWTDARKEKAVQKGLGPKTATILASIVEEESQMKSERPTIAGLYLNRLNKGMKLQADPTVKFALGDFEIRRVLAKDLKTESPYNTYLNIGLPPGPICIPSINSIEAVLNAEEHNYLYMCAKVDAPGYHAFARTHSQHVANAVKFQAWLNEREIYR